MINKSPIIIRILFLLILASLLSFKSIIAQNIVLKPDEKITPFYSLEEWIYSNANWGFDSYDLTNFEPFSPFFSSSLEAAPILFINNQRYSTAWLNNDLFDFPNLSFSIIDSVVLQPYEKITNGVFTPNGSIQIFLKELNRSVIFDKELANQINDPGPHLGTELRTANVEYVNKVHKAVISLPEILNTTFIYSGNNFSRTNVLEYNRLVNNTLYGRTQLINSNEQDKFQGNKEHDFVLINQVNTSLLTLDLLSSFSLKNQYYQWYSLTGVEIPATHKKGQLSINANLNRESIYKSTSFTISYATADSLKHDSRTKYNLNETLFNHVSSFQFGNNKNQLDVHIGNSVSYWKNFLITRSKLINNNSVTIAYKSSVLGKLNLFLSNYNIGFEYRKEMQKKYTVSVSSFNTDLRGNGYNYTLWLDGIGFSNLDPTKHSVLNGSDFSNFYSTVTLSSMYSSELVKLDWNVLSKHYWSFVNTNIAYEYNRRFEELNSNIIYSDLNNVGFLGYSASAKLKPFDKTYLKSSLSGHFFRYGDASFTGNLDRLNSIIFSQSIRFVPDEKAIFEFLYKYISPGNIIEFEPLEQGFGVYTKRVRPINLLNASLKTIVFDNSLALTLTLRNLLNSTESYNTNGQYYNMSIHVGASLHLGKK